MSKEKLGLGFLKSAMTGSWAGILLYLFLSALLIFYYAGRWMAALWFWLVRRRTETGKVQAFEQLWYVFAACFTTSLIASYFVLGLIFYRLDPYADWDRVLPWLAGIYGLLVLVKVVSDARTFWQETPPYIPIAQGEGVMLPAGEDEGNPSKLWLRGLFHAKRVVQSKVEEDDETWDDEFFSF